MTNIGEIPQDGKRVESMGRSLVEAGYHYLLGGLPLSDLVARKPVGNNLFRRSPVEGFLSLDKSSENIFDDISGIILRELSINERTVLDNDGKMRIWQVGECPLFVGKGKLGNMVFSYNKDLKMLKAEIPVSKKDFDKGNESEILDCLRDTWGNPIYDKRIGPDGFWIDVLAWGPDSNMPEAGHFVQALSWVYPENF